MLSNSDPDNEFKQKQDRIKLDIKSIRYLSHQITYYLAYLDKKQGGELTPKEILRVFDFDIANFKDEIASKVQFSQDQEILTKFEIKNQNFSFENFLTDPASALNTIDQLTLDIDSTEKETLVYHKLKLIRLYQQIAEMNVAIQNAIVLENNRSIEQTVKDCKDVFSPLLKNVCKTLDAMAIAEDRVKEKKIVLSTEEEKRLGDLQNKIRIQIMALGLRRQSKLDIAHLLKTPEGAKKILTITPSLINRKYEADYLISLYLKTCRPLSPTSLKNVEHEFEQGVLYQKQRYGNGFDFVSPMTDRFPPKFNHHKWKGVVACDFDGPFNEIDSNLGSVHINITDSDFILTTLRILVANDILPVSASQRTLYPDCDQQQARLRAEMLRSLKKFPMITKEHADFIREDVDARGMSADDTVGSKVCMLEAVKRIPGCESIDKAKVYLIDDSFIYKHSTEKAGYNFVYVKRHADKGGYRDRLHWVELLLKTTVNTGKTFAELQENIKNRSVSPEVKKDLEELVKNYEYYKKVEGIREKVAECLKKLNSVNPSSSVDKFKNDIIVQLLALLSLDDATSIKIWYYLSTVQSSMVEIEKLVIKNTTAEKFSNVQTLLKFYKDSLEQKNSGKLAQEELKNQFELFKTGIPKNEYTLDPIARLKNIEKTLDQNIIVEEKFENIEVGSTQLKNNIEKELIALGSNYFQCRNIRKLLSKKDITNDELKNKIGEQLPLNKHKYVMHWLGLRSSVVITMKKDNPVKDLSEFLTQYNLSKENIKNIDALKLQISHEMISLGSSVLNRRKIKALISDNKLDSKNLLRLVGANNKPQALYWLTFYGMVNSHPNYCASAKIQAFKKEFERVKNNRKEENIAVNQVHSTNVASSEAKCNENALIKASDGEINTLKEKINNELFSLLKIDTSASLRIAYYLSTGEIISLEHIKTYVVVGREEEAAYWVALYNKVNQVQNSSVAVQELLSTQFLDFKKYIAEQKITEPESFGKRDPISNPFNRLKQLECKMIDKRVAIAGEPQAIKKLKDDIQKELIALGSNYFRRQKIQNILSNDNTPTEGIFHLVSANNTPEVRFWLDFYEIVKKNKEGKCLQEFQDLFEKVKYNKKLLLETAIYGSTSRIGFVGSSGRHLEEKFIERSMGLAERDSFKQSSEYQGKEGKDNVESEKIRQQIV